MNGECELVPPHGSCPNGFEVMPCSVIKEKKDALCLTILEGALVVNQDKQCTLRV
jgi:hypothetical protein